MINFKALEINKIDLNHLQTLVSTLAIEVCAYLGVDVFDHRVDVDDVVLGERLSRAAVQGVVTEQQLDPQLLTERAQQRHLL